MKNLIIASGLLLLGLFCGCSSTTPATPSNSSNPSPTATPYYSYEVTAPVGSAVSISYANTAATNAVTNLTFAAPSTCSVCPLSTWQSSNFSLPQGTSYSLFVTTTSGSVTLLTLDLLKNGTGADSAVAQSSITFACLQGNLP